MRHSVTFLELQFDALQEHLFGSDDTFEQAAFAICRLSRGKTEVRILVQSVLPVLPADILSQTAVNIDIAPIAFIRAMKAADAIGGSMLLIHTHPGGRLEHSEQDNREETKLFKTAFHRVHDSVVHGSLILTRPGQICGRAWLPDDVTAPIDVIRVVGKRLRMYFAGGYPEIHPNMFDRQILAFGSHIQGLLSRLSVGVVGNGGTGSAVAEQLIRLGVGQLVCVDGDTFHVTNINRVYGSFVDDHAVPKPNIVVRSARFIGTGTTVKAIPKNVTFPSVVQQLKECDVVFGCTDDEGGRGILSRMSIYYAIPVFDMGVKIDSHEGKITRVEGRVTTLIPGAACLFCRGRISANNIGAERLREVNKDKSADERAAEYIPDLPERAPAVIAFTTEVAATAVSELLHRLTGFMGEDRKSSETLLLIDRSTKRTNSTEPKPGCWCNKETWCKGDSRHLLDLRWRRDEN